MSYPDRTLKYRATSRTGRELRSNGGPFIDLVVKSG